jgi:outer membrane protein TolC
MLGISSTAWGQSPTPTPNLTQVPAPAIATGPVLHLEDALQLAATRNERARIADLNVTTAYEGVVKARASFLPIVSLTANESLRTTPPTPLNTGTAALQLTQPLLDAPAFPLYAEAKESFVGQQEQSVEDKRTLAFDTARAFFGVLNAQAVLKAAQNQVDAAQANYADTQARVDAQLNSSNDATRAQVDLANANREVETDKGVLGSAVLALVLVVNAPVPAELAPPEATLSASQQPVSNADQLVKFAIEKRLDLSARRHAGMAAHYFADEPLLRMIPTLNLTGQAAATTNAPTNGRWDSAAASLNLSWILYDAGVRYSDKRSRDASAEIADLQAATLERTVENEVRTSLVALASTQATFAVAERGVVLARKNAEETGALYKQGLAKAIELVDANDQLFNAEVSEVQARYAMALAYLSLRNTLGLDPLGTELR